MLFNSVDFLFYLPTVFAIYWLLNANLRLQNFFLVVASYFFYSWWNWKFLGLLLLSTLIDYTFGFLVNTENAKKRKLFMWLSIFNNLAVLGLFKYYNFFVEEVQQLLGLFSFHIDSYILNIVLPVGISFYTFHGISYVLDIYNGKFKPVRNFFDYALFVNFFPLLVAGPIERAWHLLPQIQSKRRFNYDQAFSGIKLILLGMFKKVVIADNLAIIVNDVFQHYGKYSGSTLILGAIYFSFQIYCDFSGYSDIALGTAKLFGFELLSNFRFPYFSRSIPEFWRRWHISLSSWFRDYVYIPLGGSKVNKRKALSNVFIIFLLSGFWHGANWTFIVWGLMHALLFVPSFIVGTNRKYSNGVIAENSIVPSVRECLGIITTFVFVTIAWIFFRSPNVGSAIDYISHFSLDIPLYKSGIVYVVAMVLLDWINRRDERDPFQNKYPLLTIVLLLFAILLFRYENTGNIEFIYFQF